jgi:type 1 glutamine amidotransferase
MAKQKNPILLLMIVGFAFAFTAQAVEPLRALLITGGCCHDYEAQKKILTEGISARANVVWTILHEAGSDEKTHEFSIYKKPNWTANYDVIVHNECSGMVTNVDFVNSIVREQTNSGVGVVTIHCATHSYRNAATDEWRKLLGVTSMRHQPKRAFDVLNVNPAHAIMKSFPAKWRDPEDELYEITKVWPNTIPLAKSVTPKKENNQHVSIWINTFGKCKVFGTTLGHLNETMQSDIYLDLVTRGLLWTCNKLDENGEPKPGFGKQVTSTQGSAKPSN